MPVTSQVRRCISTVVVTLGNPMDNRPPLHASEKRSEAPAPLVRTLILPAIAATLGGYLWQTLGLPLGWLMGSAIMIGGLALSGLSIQMPKPLHRGGLLIVGSSVGLWVTPEVASQMLGWLPVMLVSAVLGITLAIALTPLFARLSGLDTATAYFCLLPGGVIEMAEIGERYSANRAAIAALHATRVGLIVTLIPAIAQHYGHQDPMLSGGGHALSAPLLISVLGLSMLASTFTSRLGMPSAWLLTPLIISGVMSGAEFTNSGQMPGWLLIIAQLIVGFSLGAKFKRESLLALPRALVTGIVILLVIGSLVSGAALIFALFSEGETAMTLVLSFAVGGMAEMTLTAKVLGQNAALVAAFHAVRAVTVNLFAGPLWARLTRNSTTDE